MHPKGSKAPPPSAPSLDQAISLLKSYQKLQAQWNDHMSQNQPLLSEVQEIFHGCPFLTPSHYDDLMDRAKKLVETINTTFRKFNVEEGRKLWEEYEMLERQFGKRSEDMVRLEGDLSTYHTNPPQQLSEVQQLRAENTRYMVENRRLGEDVEEKDAIIRDLRKRVRFLEEKYEGKGEREEGGKKRRV